MFTITEKNKYIRGEKVYQKLNGESSYPIGQLVKVDWVMPKQDNYFGVNSISELESQLLKWVSEQEVFIITDVKNSGSNSTVILDECLEVPIFRIMKVETDEYLFKFRERDTY